MLCLSKSWKKLKHDITNCILVSDYLEVVFSFILFFTNGIFFYDFIFHKSETRTVLFEVGIVLGLLKKTLLKTSKIVLMYSNSLARHFSSMFHAKCLLPRLDRLLPLRSCLQNFYQCTGWKISLHLQIYILVDLRNMGRNIQDKMYNQRCS